MNKKFLTQEQKNKILDMVLNTRKTYKKIADINGTSLEQVYDLIEEYCREKNYKTIRRTKNGAEFGKQTNKRKRPKILKNAQEIEKWVEENGRKPRQKIKGVKTVKKGEKETEEQEELRLGHALNHIRTFVMKGYEGKDLEEIKDKTDREMVRIIREIDKNYEDNLKTYYEKLRKQEKDKPAKRNVKFVQKLGNEKMGKMIINLIKTKNATEEQIKTIAEFYGVDLEKVVNNREER